MKKNNLHFVISVLIALTATFAQAQYTPGNLVVSRMGYRGQGGALGSTGTQIFIDQYTTSGTFVDSLALPNTTSGSINRIVESGSAGSDGQFSLSDDGQYLSLTGYDAALATPTVASTAGINRVAARVDYNRTIITQPFTAASTFSGNNIRGSVYDCSGNIWLSGTPGGIRAYGPFTTSSASAVASTVASSTVSNTRTVKIFNGQLYMCTGSAPVGIYKIGTGLPTLGATGTLLFTPNASNTSPYAFYMLAIGGGYVCYIADDGGASNGGVYKYSSPDMVTWTFQGRIAQTGVTGVAAAISGSNVNIYACTSTAGASAIYAVTDVNAYNAAPSITTLGTAIATAAANTGFRGISFAPVKLDTLKQASNVTFGTIASNGMTISWANGSGKSHAVYISTTNSFSPPAAGSAPGAANIIGNGTSTQPQQLVYSGSGNSVAITGLAAGTTYYVKVYDYNYAQDMTVIPACSYIYDTKDTVNNPNSQATAAVACTIPTNVTNFLACATASQTASLSWLNGTCYDNMLIVASAPNSTVSSVPTGTTFSASGTYGSGTTNTSGIAAGEYVVYFSNSNSATVSNLTNGSSYQFKIFTLRGTTWSSGVIVSSTSVATPQYFWNGGNISANPANGGSGIWSTANSWRSPTASGCQASFNDAFENIFTGTAGTVTVDGNHNATQYTFNTSGYVLTTPSTTSFLISGSPSAANMAPIVLGNNINLTLSPNAGSATGGVLGIGNVSGTGSATVNINGTATGGNATLVAFTSNNATVSVPTTITSSATGSAGYVARATGASLTGGVINNSADTTILGATNTNNLTIATTGISGSAPLKFANGANGGAGLINLNVASTYTGATIFNAATSSCVKLGVDNALSTTTDVVMAYSSSNGGTLDLNGRNQTIGSIISGAGTSVITDSGATGTHTLTIAGSNAPAGSFASVIKNGPTAIIALTRIGSGSTTLAGTNTYTGATTIGGTSTLYINGSIAAGSATSVGATATLAGSGSLNGTVSLSGTVSPGSTGATVAGTLTTGSATWNSGAKYKFNLNAASGTAGTNWDLVSSSSAIFSSSGSYAIDVTGNPTGFSSSSSYSWKVIGTSGITNFVPANWTIQTTNFVPAFAGQGDFTLAQSGNDILLVYTAHVPSVNASPGSLTGFTASPISNSAYQSYSVSAAYLTPGAVVSVYTSTVNYEISSDTTSFAAHVSSNPLTFTSDTSGTLVATPIYVRLKGGLSGGSYTDVVTNVNGSLNSPVSLSSTVITPTINANLTPLNFGNQALNVTSASKTFTVSGTNLISDLHISAPTQFKVSLSPCTGFDTALTIPVAGHNAISGASLATTTVYVQFTPIVTITFTNSVNISGLAATTQLVQVQGTGISPSAGYTPNNLVVYTLGTSCAALTSAGTPITLVEYTTSGVYTGYTVTLPTTGTSAIVTSGSATSEGDLTLSPDMLHLAVGGYNAPAGTAGVASASSATVPRAAATITSDGNISVLTTTLSSGNNSRSAVADDCGNVWMGSSNNGAVYMGTATAPVATANANVRRMGIFNKQLYYSTSSGAGIYKVGTGLPTTGGQTVTAELTYSGTGVGASPYGFYFNSAMNICYIADDGTTGTANGSGIEKWTKTGATWSLAYTIGTGVSNVGARSLTVDFSGTKAIIYATTAEATQNRLIKIVDNGSTLTDTAITISTAVTNTVYRGVTFSPIDAPSGTIDYATASSCAGNDTVIVNRTATAGGKFTATPTGLTIDSVTGAIFKATSAPGSYVITYTIKAKAGCTLLTDTGRYTLYAKPTAVLAGPNAVCNGSSVNLTITATGNAPFAGTLSDGTTFTGASSPFIVAVSPTSPTTYSIATLTDAHCTALTSALTGSDTININTRPTANMSGANSICAGAIETYSVVLTGTAPWSLTIDTGGGQINATTSSSTYTFTVKPTVTKTVKVSSLTDGHGCSAQYAELDSVLITVTTNCAITWTGATSTSWHTASNWNPALVPNSCSVDVVIPSGTTNKPVISTTNIQVGNITIGNTLLTLASHTLSICKNLTGTFTASTPGNVQGSGSMVMNGTSAQTILGYNNINELTINNAGGVTLPNQTYNRINIYRGLNLKAGNLSVAGSAYVTLLSNSVDTVAYLNDFTAGYTGTYSGMINVQRKIATTGTAWQHQVSSPVFATGNTFASLGQAPYGWHNNAYLIPSSNCSEDSLDYTSPYSTGLTWHESNVNATTAPCATRGWQTVASTDTWLKGIGYALYLNSASKITLQGSPNTGAISISGLTNSNWSVHTPEGHNFNSGWSFIGNPYPSSLDMSVSRIPDGFDNQVQIYQPTGAYRGSYQPGILGNSSAPVTVSAFQGMWVRKTNAGGTATWPFVTSERTTAQGTAYHFYKQAGENSLKLSVSGNGFADLTQIRFLDAATEGFDAEFDANKFHSNEGQPTLYTLAAGSDHWIGINTMPRVTNAAIVPMGFEAGTAGTFSITADQDDLSGFDQDINIYLEDKLNPAHWTDLRSSPVYTFTADVNDAHNRFVIHFAKTQAGINNLNNNSNLNIFAVNRDVMVDFSKMKNVDARIQVYNVLGQEISNEKHNTSDMYVRSMNNVEAAYVIVNVTMADGEMMTRKLFITK